MNDAVPYKHSGRTGGGLILLPIVGTVTALICGFIYAYIAVYNPLIGYVSVLLPFGLGFVIGTVVLMGARASKCRSESIAALAGFFTGLFTLYIAWAVFVYALLNRYATTPTNLSLPALIVSPNAVWGIMGLIADNGWFSIFKSTPSGIVLWMFWGLEALIVLGVSTFLPMSNLKDSVFCENCNKWCEEKADIIRFNRPYGESELMTRVSSGDLSALSELEPHTTVNTPHLRVHTQRCAGCGETETFQIKHVTYESSEKGLKENLADVTGHIIPGPSSLMALQTAMLARENAAAQMAPRAPVQRLAESFPSA